MRQGSPSSPSCSSPAQVSEPSAPPRLPARLASGPAKGFVATRRCLNQDCPTCCSPAAWLHVRQGLPRPLACALHPFLFLCLPALSLPPPSRAPRARRRNTHWTSARRPLALLSTCLSSRAARRSLDPQDVAEQQREAAPATTLQTRRDHGLRDRRGLHGRCAVELRVRAPRACRRNTHWVSARRPLALLNTCLSSRAARRSLDPQDVAEQQQREAAPATTLQTRRGHGLRDHRGLHGLHGRWLMSQAPAERIRPSRGCARQEGQAP